MTYTINKLKAPKYMAMNLGGKPITKPANFGGPENFAAWKIFPDPLKFDEPPRWSLNFA